MFLQAYYKIEYLITVKPGTFNPPPKVHSAVIRLTRNEVETLDCDEKLFWRVVKAGFNQRRKTLRNAVSAVMPKDKMDNHIYFEKRAEQLTVADFVALTQHVSQLMAV
ncbi:Ribosomal RNA small subunit methyltransferase A [compost metagenome]